MLDGRLLYLTHMVDSVSFWKLGRILSICLWLPVKKTADSMLDHSDSGLSMKEWTWACQTQLQYDGLLILIICHYELWNCNIHIDSQRLFTREPEVSQMKVNHNLVCAYRINLNIIQIRLLKLLNEYVIN